MNNNIEDAVQTAQTQLVKTVKNRVFDLLAVGLIIAMLMLHLGVLELRDVTLIGLLNIGLECAPFYLTSVLLSVNFYTKGTFTGKSKTIYTNAIKVYSEKTNSLTGKQLDSLSDFCQHYNDNALRRLQSSILKTVSISYERFNDGDVLEDGTSLPALKALSKDELSALYTEERVAAIVKAKKVKIKGISDNILLGNTENKDTTDLGPTEKQLSTHRTTVVAIRYLFSTLLLALIGIRDVLEWGWIGLLIVAFKLIYILCSSYINYFKGYNDITINLVNHIARKTDILKQFEYWYDNRNSTTDANSNI